MFGVFLCFWVLLIVSVQLSWGLVNVRVVGDCFLACLVAFFIYSACTLLHHFASVFNIFSLFTYKRKGSFCLKSLEF